MRTPMKKKKIILWPVVFWCFSELRIIQSVQDSLSAGVAVDLRKEDFWIIGATQESKSSNVLMIILKFLKKYYLPYNSRSFTSVGNKIFPPSLERFSSSSTSSSVCFIIWYCPLLIKFNNRFCCSRSKILIIFLVDKFKPSMRSN